MYLCMEAVKLTMLNTFFLRCRLYGELRADLLETVSHYCTISLPVLLNGEEILSLDSNIAIFEVVQKVYTFK